MKERIIILICFTSSMVFSQKTEGTIHFKDGTEKIGYVKYGPKPLLSDISIMDKVKFRTSKESNEISEFEYTDIAKIDLMKDGEILSTSYFKTLKKNPNIILEVTLVHKGNVSLFTHIAHVNTPNSYGGGSIREYYVQRDEENIVKIFPGKVMGISSEKLMMRFFSDCPKLVELIDREAFKRFVANSPGLAKNKNANRLIEIVKYYNSKCLREN